jgi:hypothetical protein
MNVRKLIVRSPMRLAVFADAVLSVTGASPSRAKAASPPHSMAGERKDEGGSPP